MLKRNLTILAISIAATVTNSYADYTIIIPLDKQSIRFIDMQTYESIYGEWMNVREVYECNNWSPSSSEVTIGETFTQTATDCNQDQERTVQPRKQDVKTGEVRNDGPLYTETRTIEASSTREGVGEKETWVLIDPRIISDWASVGGIYECINWTPATSTVDYNELFTQTTNECKQDQNRTLQNVEQETTTKETRDVGVQYTEVQTIAANSSQNAYGTRATITNYPLRKGNSHIDSLADGSVSTNGTAGTLLYGPYVKSMPTGTYNLKMYGWVGNANGAYADIASSGGNVIHFQQGLPASGSGLLLNQNVYIENIDSNYGLEVRVMVNAGSSLIIDGYVLEKIN